MASGLYEDFDNFLKTEKEKENELSIFHSFKEVLQDIKTSQELTRTLIKRSSSAGQKSTNKAHVYPAHSINQSTLYSSNSNRNIFNVFNTPFASYFDQVTIKPLKKFYSKKNECGLINELVEQRIKDKLRRLFYKTYIDNENEYKRNRSKDTERFKLGKLGGSPRSNKSHELDRSGASDIHKSVSARDSSSHNYISRIYPEPKQPEPLLTTKFVTNKILEYRFNGELNKKVDVKDLMKKFKIKSNKREADCMIKENMEDVTRAVTNYARSKVRKQTEKTGVVTEPVYPGFVDTTAKFYVKYDRNLPELKISK